MQTAAIIDGLTHMINEDYFQSWHRLDFFPKNQTSNAIRLVVQYSPTEPGVVFANKLQNNGTKKHQGNAFQKRSWFVCLIIDMANCMVMRPEVSKFNKTGVLTFMYVVTFFCWLHLNQPKTFA